MRFDIRTFGNPRQIMEAHIDAAERAVTRGVRRAGTGLKRDWRGQVTGAGLGKKLGDTIRCEVYPEDQQSINAASLVYSRAPKVIEAHDKGALIRSQDGFWLAIPIGEVQKMRAPKGIGGQHRFRITPAGWEQKTGRRLRFVYRKGKPSLLVDDGTPISHEYGGDIRFRRKRIKRAQKDLVTPIFLLVPQAKLRRKLDLGHATDEWERRFPRLILDSWKKVPNG